MECKRELPGERRNGGCRCDTQCSGSQPICTFQISWKRPTHITAGSHGLLLLIQQQKSLDWKLLKVTLVAGRFKLSEDICHRSSEAPYRNLITPNKEMSPYYIRVPVHPVTLEMNFEAGNSSTPRISASFTNDILQLPSGLRLEASLSVAQQLAPTTSTKLAILLHPWSWLGGRMHDPCVRVQLRHSVCFSRYDTEFYVTSGILC